MIPCMLVTVEMSLRSYDIYIKVNIMFVKLCMKICNSLSRQRDSVILGSFMYSVLHINSYCLSLHFCKKTSLLKVFLR